MRLLITNKNNGTLDLLNNRSKFILYKVENLHGIEVDIATNESPYIDGVSIESVKALPRGIELGFKLIGDVKESIDFITSYIKSKQVITLREIDEEKDIIIKGIVNIPPYSRMLASCELSLSIYCGQPYWEDLDYIIGVITHELDLLNFPQQGQYFTELGRPFGAIDTSLQKTFTNTSDVNVGMHMQLIAMGDVTNPRISCSSGEQNGYYMQVNVTLEETDILEISTIKGNKYITINGLTTYNDVPILSKLVFNGEDWLQLEQGSNTFNITATSGADNIYFNIEYKGRYE